MQLCRQYTANSDSSEGVSSALEFETSLVVTYLVPLEQGITVCTESHPHHDRGACLSTCENQCSGVVSEYELLHGNTVFHEHTSSVSHCTAEEGSVSGQDQDVSDEDCNPYVSETEDVNEDDSGKDDTDHDDIDEYLSCGLGARASDFNIPHSAVSLFLGILRTLHPHLPKDPRTLLGTASSTVDTSGYVDAQLSTYS